MPRVFILTVAEQLPPEQTIWGTGGWIPPDQREALDWLVLVRTLGWPVETIYPADVDSRLRSLDVRDVVIVACDPGQIPETAASLLEDLLRRRAYSLIFRKSARPSGEVPRLFGCSSEDRIFGQRLVWQAEDVAKTWVCRSPMESACLEATGSTRALATLDGRAVITERNHAGGRCLMLGFHPSVGADQGGACIAMLRHLLTFHPHVSRAWHDWSGTLALRMDDPGGAQNVYSRNWCYQKLDRSAWRQIGRDLAKRQARLSIGYVGGWVDDGDDRRGTLWLDGKLASRHAGAIHPSPRVRYLDHRGHMPGMDNDYQSEYQGIQELRRTGVADVELHGFTHLHPNLRDWIEAPDRYENRTWFRDFGPTSNEYLASLESRLHPICRGIECIEEYFGTRPVCLISPGDEWTSEVLQQALRSQLRLVSSYYLAVRQADRFCWSTHICAPYLDQPAAHWFVSGLPVVGYFHDYEPATEGVDWLTRNLDRWCEAGARRFVDFREMAAALATELSVARENGEPILRLEQQADAIPWPRPLPVRLRCCDGRLPETVKCRMDEEERIAPVVRESEFEGLVLVPVFSGRRHQASPQNDHVE